MKRLTVRGDERSLRYAFILVTNKGVCSDDPAVARLSKYASMSGREVEGGERGRATLPVQRMIVGPLKSSLEYDTFDFSYDDMRAFKAFLEANGAACKVKTYGTADEFPELSIGFDEELLDKMGLSA